jgi:hypothetical protein
MLNSLDNSKDPYSFKTGKCYKWTIDGYIETKCR